MPVTANAKEIMRLLLGGSPARAKAAIAEARQELTRLGHELDLLEVWLSQEPEYRQDSIPGLVATVPVAASNGVTTHRRRKNRGQRTAERLDVRHAANELADTRHSGATVTTDDIAAKLGRPADKDFKTSVGLYMRGAPGWETVASGAYKRRSPASS